MNDEFPSLEEVDYQKEFLRDWWVPRKLFVGKRMTGKTELMISELRRFERHEFLCLFLAPTVSDIDRFRRRYYELFGKQPTCGVGSYNQLEDGGLRGTKFDVIIMDEVQETAFQNIAHEIQPMNPVFYRASADEGSLNSVHYLNDEPGFFDKVYTSY